jgi:hypothetical protein
VLVEPLVLDGEDRLAHDRRDLVERHDDAVVVVERREHRAVRREHRRLLRQRALLAELRGQVVERGDRQVGRAVRDGDGGQDEPGGEQAPDTGHEDERQEQRERLERVDLTAAHRGSHDP